MTRFAWLPVPLSTLRGAHWHRTGRRAWLRRVRVVLTFWGDVVYTEPLP